MDAYEALFLAHSTRQCARPKSWAGIGEAVIFDRPQPSSVWSGHLCLLPFTDGKLRPWPVGITQVEQLLKDWEVVEKEIVFAERR